VGKLYTPVSPSCSVICRFADPYTVCCKIRFIARCLTCCLKCHVTSAPLIVLHSKVLKRSSASFFFRQCFRLYLTLNKDRSSLTGWTIRGSNPGTDERFFSSKRPDRPCGSPSFLLNGYRGSFPGVKWPDREVNHSIWCRG
jgi:hypothetical protein